MSIDRDLLITLRRTLQSCPEVAGDEVRTANVITSFLRHYKPSRIVSNLGGWGVAAVFEGSGDGPTILVRCELDALTVSEQLPESPAEPQYAHLCGHDGHMVMVAGLAPILYGNRSRYRVVLLFQPAEETGEGARRVLADPRFSQIAPDYALALHNLPGFALGHVVCRHGTFASSSVGMHARFLGRSSHAAEPENAHSPLASMRNLTKRLEELGATDGASPHRLVTITHILLGQPTHGVTPGEGTVLATLRSESGNDMDVFRSEVERIVYTEKEDENLTVTLEWCEDFPETRSHDALVAALGSVCAAHSIPTIEPSSPFRWSEDFGHYAQVCPILYFGLGSGVDAPRLHQHDYQFPDEIIPTGVAIFQHLLEQIAAQHPKA